jgi:hypothetical protein
MTVLHVPLLPAVVRTTGSLLSLASHTALGELGAPPATHRAETQASQAQALPSGSPSRCSLNFGELHRLIALQTKHSLQPQRADTVLLTGHPPHGLKPQSQGSAGVLKDRPRSHRGLMSTGTAAVPFSAKGLREWGLRAQQNTRVSEHSKESSLVLNFVNTVTYN